MMEVLCLEKHMKLFHFKTIHVWFPENEYLCQSKCDLIRLNGGRSMNKNCRQRFLQKTIYIDLSQPTDEIFAAFKRQHRQQIKKSETDGVTTRILDSASIIKDDDVLVDLMRMYRRMYQDKGMDRSLDIDILQEYAKCGLLWISSIIQEGKPIVYHTLVSDRQTVRALQSCSLFREQDSQAQQIIGRANKKLHWDEMQYFKQLGVVTYDFGGIFADTSTDPGINQFKMGFGGDCGECYKELIVCSAKARLYLLISRILHRNTL